jgi:hypothetical protein
MRPAKKIGYIFLFIFFYWACNVEESPIIHEDLVFTNAFQIKVLYYQYDTLGITYTVRGDTSYYSSYPDTLNSRPQFKWDTAGLEIITVAIFTQPIEISGGEIVNPQDIIWQWHSGMEIESGGSEGDVKYFQGRNVIHNSNDTIDYQNTARPLDIGHYYWAVWGWDPSGIRVWYSSRQLEFYVSE